MIKSHTMNKAKIAITVNPLILGHLDALVERHHFTSRSQAIEIAVEAHLQRLENTRLAAQCALLDKDEERGLAEEGLQAEAQSWPKF